MSDKAAKKKQFILDTAKVVFSKKGFKDVTMKDIVEACDISRGGLYIYFDNTEQILLECLSEEDLHPNSFSEHSAGEALAMFLNEQKKDILGKENNLSVAVYEYLFSKHAAGADEKIFSSQSSKALATLTGILEKGASDGEFYAEDCDLAAKNIMYCLQGLKVTANIFGVSEKDVDDELLYILSGLIMEE